jgi:DNA repair exonuclease SbcCD ATPase subunit
MNKTTLIIKRVIIKATSKTVYDEIFHKGLNVIRGYNGTGKSTIMELISYGLGGDIKKHSWKGEALACSNISILLELNGKPFVFKRAIEEETSKPQIEIFEGTFLDSQKINAEWTYYKNSKSEVRKSYSMQIFELLGMQQHNTADSESLTMHQLLRILYIDQDTPASKIFRTEHFSYDKESMRKAIGEYAFGFDNLEAHALRQKLYDLNKRFDKLKDELLTVYKVLGQTNIKATTKEIDADIHSLLTDLNELTVQKQDMKLNEDNFSSSGSAKEANEIKEQINKQTKLIAELESEFISTTYDIAESIEFIGTLEYRKQSLEKANATSLSLGHLSFKFCPNCMEEVDISSESNNCCLCNRPSKKAIVNETYIQAVNELDFQLTETQQMLELQQKYRAQLEAEVKNHKETSNHLKSNFNEVNSYTSDYENEIAKFANQKGFIEAQIENLKDRQALASDLDAKRKIKDELQNAISEMETKLTNLEAARASRIHSVKGKISKKVIDILSKEGGIEPAFDLAETFDFDFATDSMRLDDRANFSASSNVVLKNAFHLAALLTAVNDNEFRIPCFSMFDNIEDKGMREDRSQIFQRTIAELTSKITNDFQIIMTTSMVDPTLNNVKYGVGPYYDKGVHTLNM